MKQMTYEDRMSAIMKIAESQWEPDVVSMDQLGKDALGKSKAYEKRKKKLIGQQADINEHADSIDSLGTASYSAASVPATIGVYTGTRQILNKGLPIKARIGKGLGRIGFGASATGLLVWLAKFLRDKSNLTREEAKKLDKPISEAQHMQDKYKNTSNKLKSGYLPNGKFVWRWWR